MTLSDDQIAVIALSTISGLGPARMRALTRCLGSPSKALRVGEHVLREVPGIGKTLARQIKSLDARGEVLRQLALARRVSARMVLRRQPAYPPLLRQIADPPPFLWARGREDVGLDYSVAIVGSRRATRYGQRTAFLFARDLAASGFTIVSGLAYGIDSAAHRGALAAGGRTVGVLGSGVDVVYPAAHRSLFKGIIDSGVLYSEFPMGTKPDGTNFPRRNRLISGMSLGVIVVEAYEQGGGLITARFALDQNREVFSVPGPITSPPSLGSNLLIRDGLAKLVTGVQDVIDELPVPAGAKRPESRAIEELSGQEHELAHSISENGSDLDTISFRSGIEVSTALAGLLSLELKGVVRQGVGGRFFLVDAVRGSN